MMSHRFRQPAPVNGHNYQHNHVMDTDQYEMKGLSTLSTPQHPADDEKHPHAFVDIQLIPV